MSNEPRYYIHNLEIYDGDRPLYDTDVLDRLNEQDDDLERARAKLNAFPALVRELETAIKWIEDLPERVNTLLDDPSAPHKGELLPQLRAALAQAGVADE